MNKLSFILKAIEGAPDQFQVLPFGTVEMEGEGSADVDDEAMNAINAEFARRGNEMVIDYEHQTLTGAEAPAAGWIRSLINKGAEGLWAVVEWTERARQYLAAKEYRYFSPVFWVRKADRKVVAIETIALTNAPKINNLRPIIAKMTGYGDNAQHIKEDAIMWEKLLKLLGLAADAGEDKVVETVEAVKAKNQELTQSLEAVTAKNTLLEKGGGIVKVACKEVLEGLGLKEDATLEGATAAIEALKAPATAAQELSRQVATLTTEIATMKQEDLVGLALKEGKTSPDELDKWARDLALKSPEQFKLIVLSRPAGSVVPLEHIPPAPAEDKAGLTGEVLTVAKQMGVSQEDLKKYGGLQ